MKRDFYSDGQGKGRLPLQPHPKNKTRAVYTEELTHLSPSQRAKDLLHRTRLDAVFKVYETDAEAVAAFPADPGLP